ncbi:hypothetical protein BJ165DRAFT_1527797 [Panaeolus papilionaceus]|nr:hypothetical protein BJ165DRAFT_1527797 [Panaeolus papilionaceus]
MPVNIMESTVPRITLEDGNKVPVLHPHMPQEFPSFPPHVQRKAIRLLEGLLEEVRADASIAHLRQLGLMDKDEAEAAQHDDELKGVFKSNTIDACCWQLAQLLKASTPTRIGEAVPHLTYVVNLRHAQAPEHADIDVIPLLYLGVAQARSGDDQRAIDTLETAMSRLNMPGVQDHPWNMMWARAHLAWLYRKEGRVSEAESQEEAVCNWIVGHPFAFPPSVLLNAITDEEIPELGAHIVEDPHVQRFLSNVFEMGPGMAIYMQ